MTVPRDAERPPVLQPSIASGPRKRLAPLVIGAIGVVYGDIGTSPLYTLRQCFTGAHHLPLTPGNVLGVLSIIFWALMIIVTLKYITLIMRADNRGEGGILALTALVARGTEHNTRRRWWLVGFGIFGAAMFYGDGMITPAISVLGAVEGLEIIAPQLHPFIVPVTLVILATCAAVIASQAVISGAFSLTRAAIQMGYCPRLRLLHTSAREIGQIYVPFINWSLLVAVMLLVVGFRSSDNLGGAYGIAVTLAMLIDSVLIYFVMRRMWRWRAAAASCRVGGGLPPDLLQDAGKECIRP